MRYPLFWFFTFFSVFQQHQLWLLFSSDFLFSSKLYTAELPVLLLVLGSEQFVIFFWLFFSTCAEHLCWLLVTPGRIFWYRWYHSLQLSHSTISPFSSHLSQYSPHMYTKQTYNTKQNLTQNKSCEKCFFIGRRRKTIITSSLAKQSIINSLWWRSTQP